MAISFNDDEKDKLAHVFEELNIKPDTDDPETMKQWMLSYLKQQGKVPNPAPEGPKLAQFIQNPRISLFSGNVQNKDHVTFEMWKFEVSTLLKEGIHPKPSIVEALKRSLRGDAADVVRRFGIDRNIDDIVSKLEGIYGNVEASEIVLSQFYNANQGESENVASWGCRLEDLLDRANNKNNIDAGAIDEMLRTKLFSDLRSELRDVSHYKFDTIKSFDKLRIECAKSKPKVKV